MIILGKIWKEASYKFKTIFKDKTIHNVRERVRSVTNYCDMTSLGYDNVTEEYIESSESHFVDIENTIRVIIHQ